MAVPQAAFRGREPHSRLINADSDVTCDLQAAPFVAVLVMTQARMPLLELVQDGRTLAALLGHPRFEGDLLLILITRPAYLSLRYHLCSSPSRHKLHRAR